MKKIIIGLILTAVLVFSSCLGSPVTYDESIPLEQSTVIFLYGFEVSSYNGIEVPTKSSYPKGAIKSTWRYISIPAGETEFGGMAWQDTGSTYYYTNNDVFFKYKFEPGEYCLYASRFNQDYPGTWGVNIYSGKIPSAGYPAKERLICFVPLFKN